MHKIQTILIVALTSIIFTNPALAANDQAPLERAEIALDTKLICLEALDVHSDDPESEVLLAAGFFEAAKHAIPELVLCCVFGKSGVSNDYLVLNRHGYLISKKNLLLLLKQTSKSSIKPFRVIVGAKAANVKSLLSELEVDQ